MNLFSMTLVAALGALRRHTLRSALTMLGIIIGVAAVIAMVAIGNGADAAIQAQIRTLGNNLVMVMPGAFTSAGVRTGSGGMPTLRARDALAIEKECPSVARAIYYRRQLTQVVHGSENWSTAAQGTLPSYPDVRDWRLAMGRFFTVHENETADRVAVLGQTVVEHLFAPGEDPVGAYLRVKGVPFQVIGVLERKGQSAWGVDQDDLVLMPFSTAERRVLGTQFVGNVDMIFVSATSATEMTAAASEITDLLRERHHIRPGEDDDFSVRGSNEIAEASASASSVMTRLLFAVASISLVVGGIGIMNILLVSVAERTREIGIRMAVGAKPRHILFQFLVEAVILSVVGGFFGVLLGIATTTAVCYFGSWPTSVSLLSVIGSLLFSGGVGVLSGLYPANRASRLDPITALRQP